MQPMLPLRIATLQYECANPDCFYIEAIMKFHEITWKHIWSSEIEDLDLVPYCASCGEPLMVWEDE